MIWRGDKPVAVGYRLRFIFKFRLNILMPKHCLLYVLSCESTEKINTKNLILFVIYFYGGKDEFFGK